MALLAVSSQLHAWGSAGAYTLVAELLPDEDRVTGNALLSTFTQVAVVVGPGWVIGADAASFAVLAASCWAAARRRAGPVQATRKDVAPAAPVEGGWRITLGQPRLLGLIAVTCVFFFLYGPVEVALPVHIAHELHGSPGLLGL